MTDPSQPFLHKYRVIAEISVEADSPEEAFEVVLEYVEPDVLKVKLIEAFDENGYSFKPPPEPAK